MTKVKKIFIIGFVGILLIVAGFCRYSPVEDVINNTMAKVIRRSIHTFLMGVWMLSLNQRIVNKSIKKYLLLIASLLFFWMTVRFMKYDLPYEMHTLTRYLWYSYYIFMLFIPLNALFFSKYLGKSENYKLSKRMKLFYLPTFLCLFLVMTNDLHHFVFINPNDRYYYTYGFGYFLILGWIVILCSFFLVSIFQNSRLPNRGKRILLPLFFVLLVFIYSMAYIARFNIITLFFGDMTAVFGILTVFIIESCIYTGLVPSNTHYIELLHAFQGSMIITDKNYHIFKASNHADFIPVEVMKQAVRKPVVLENNIRVCAANIKGGYIFWMTDVSELSNVISELEEVNRELLQREFVLQQEYDTQHKKQSLIEKNYLYNEMQNQTKEHLEMLVHLTNQIEISQDQEKIKYLVAKAAVVTAYLKRRNNLIFLSKELGDVPASELEYCLQESLSNLRLFGRSCEMQANLLGTLRFEQITEAYDCFQKAILHFWDDFEVLFFVVKSENSKLYLSINVVSPIKMISLEKIGFTVTEEDTGEWQLEIVL